MDDIKFEIEKLNTEIIAAHNAHYIISPTGLINPKESPNGNLIFHLYSNGEISFQKGGWAYMQRSEFLIQDKLTNYRALDLKFPNEASDSFSYVILTKEECINFRDKMIKLLEILN